MKKPIFALLILMLFTGSAMALTKGEIMKCGGQLHACFQGNYNLLVDNAPASSFECQLACESDMSSVGSTACSLGDCEHACEVTFEIDQLSSGCN